ncbi:hypothetical protein CYLTODRAFT_348670 [Cylindrobasidium torrendii FP15055 ss-10]|uniref:RING-type E3 ubiquitin transferase n=1 Tax=Cylindrobasidium torrendii FP15055 ss-10 TaxID=1314674 RepID=A0A0D7BJU2_9AGAR|nr:hypothetical protein CYLTODRAFT_348670 [Cylindrobasidium torrendii FP15055 ss-10]
MRLPIFTLILFSIFSSVYARSFLSFGTHTDKSWWGWAWGAESTVSVVDRSPGVSFSSRPAAFGGDISTPILGYVIPLNNFTKPCAPNATDPIVNSSSNTGCPMLCIDGPHQPDPSEKWIALVQRGQCEFVSKVREAQRLGARAVVVGGVDPEISGLPDTLINMYSPDDSSDVKISATYIRYSDYAQLNDLIASSNTSHSGLRTLSLLITADYSAWEWYSPIVTFIIILLLPSILTFATLLIHRVRAARAAQRDRAPEDIVLNLPWQVWTGNGWEKHDGNAVARTSFEEPQIERGTENEEASTSRPPTDRQPTHPWFEDQLECAICLSEFAKGDKVRVLPCHHIFHLAEVDEWLIQRKKLCPICKADVTHPGSTAVPTLQENATEETPLLSRTEPLPQENS